MKLTPCAWATTWAVCIVAGFAALDAYDLAPGARARVDSVPAETITSLQVSPSTWTLVLFAHSECPCTLASIENVDRLLVEFGSRLEVRIVIRPFGETAAEGVESPLVLRARAIEAASVLLDGEGSLARSMGAMTSGDVSLIDPDGRVRFRGGVTDRRGHPGDSVGLEAIRKILRGDSSEDAGTPVFGCSLIDPEQE